MMKLLLAVVVVFTAVCLQCEAKTFSVCELVEELRKLKFPEKEMRDWVCLVEGESSRRTHVTGPPNSDGSRDHGLFQINDRYWCSNSDVPGNECHVTCANLRTDDITMASTCVKKIFRRHGFNAWYGWVKHCKGKNLPDISKCKYNSNYINYNI